MGKCHCGTVANALLLLLHIVLMQLSKLSTHAAVGQSGYVASFTPLDSPHFWFSQPGGNFTFGFKTVDGGDEYLLAIWHSLDVNKTAIWWADFGHVNSTNTVLKGATLNYTSSGPGLLQLYDSASSLVWQSGKNTSTSTNLHFLDTGNLKLILKTNSTATVWDSFKDRRDSLMLSTGLDASLFINNPLVLQSRRDQASYGRGRFHMATYNRLDIHLFGLDGLNRQYVYMKDYNVSLNISGDVVRVGQQLDGSAFVSDNSSLWRLSLDYDANLRVYQWASNVLTWVNVWELMDDQTLICRAQSPCGPFGLCNRSENATTIRCSCPTGYAPISPNDPTRGCNSTRIPPACGAQGTNAGNNSLVMEEVQQGDFYYNDLFWLTNIYDIAGCKNACLSNCSCIAATYDSSIFMCFLKGNSSMGYLENGLVSAEGATTLLMKLFPLPTDTGVGMAPPAKSDRHLAPIIKVVVALTASVFAALCVLLWWWKKQTCHGETHDNEAWDARPTRRFSYQELVEATKNFSDLLGEGAYGAVFRGQVRLDRKGEIEAVETSDQLGKITAVAVKVLKQRESGKRGRVENTAAKQFRAEAGTLSKIHHINLVSLLGYCIGGLGSESRRLLVYEYMENGSLDKYLSPAHRREPLPWSLRYSIAVGTAHGIAYLHHDCKPPILHCDIKPQNVLLDKNFRPKVADFGLASYVEKVDQSHLTVSCMRGTRGYMAPEWLRTDAITPKADVFSFGVLLLELVHGLNSVENSMLRFWALQCLEAGSIIQDHEIASAGDGAGEVDRSHEQIVALGDRHTSSTAPLQLPHTDTDELGDSADLVEQLRCLRVALWCIQQVPTQRPPMSQVLQQLEGDPHYIQDPPDPTATSNSARVAFADTSTSASSNNTELTCSVLSAR